MFFGYQQRDIPHRQRLLSLTQHTEDCPRHLACPKPLRGSFGLMVAGFA
jgi:hypothetical protein